jgi:acetolactate synthase-1/2/3 large subunit
VEGAAVCEIQVEDDQEKIPRPGFTIRDDQTWVAKPLEDMSPFLDRKTLQENMVIELVQED